MGKVMYFDYSHSYSSIDAGPSPLSFKIKAKICKAENYK